MLLTSRDYGWGLAVLPWVLALIYSKCTTIMLQQKYLDNFCSGVMIMWMSLHETQSNICVNKTLKHNSRSLRFVMLPYVQQ